MVVTLNQSTSLAEVIPPKIVVPKSIVFASPAVFIGS
jgi:hypothetical protein